MISPQKTSLLVYGKSGSGKTSQAGYIADYVRTKTGKKTRFISIDTGSRWAPLQSLVDDGTVIPVIFPTSYEYNPYAVMRKLRKGMWPKDGIINMPTEVKNGTEIRYQTNTAWLPWGAEEDREIGAIVVDSITSFATSFMSDAKQKNVRMGSEGAGQARREDGELLGSNTQSHYSDAHTETLDLITSFQTLMPDIYLFTALEDIGTDDSGGSKRTALGPATVGKAIVTVVPSRVQNSFHLAADGVGNKRKINAWYQDHDSDIPSLKWPAKVTLQPHELPDFWNKFKEGYIPLSLTKGIAEFLEFRDSLREKKGSK